MTRRGCVIPYQHSSSFFVKRPMILILPAFIRGCFLLSKVFDSRREVPVDRRRSIGASRYGSLPLHHHAGSEYPSRRAGTISAGTTAGGVDPGTPRSARYAPPSPRYAPPPLRLGAPRPRRVHDAEAGRPAAPGADADGTTPPPRATRRIPPSGVCRVSALVSESVCVCLSVLLRPERGGGASTGAPTRGRPPRGHRTSTRVSARLLVWSAVERSERSEGPSSNPPPSSRAGATAPSGRRRALPVEERRARSRSPRAAAARGGGPSCRRARCGPPRTHPPRRSRKRRRVRLERRRSSSPFGAPTASESNGTRARRSERCHRPRSPRTRAPSRARARAAAPPTRAGRRA